MSFLYARNYKKEICVWSDTKVSFSSSEEQEIFQKSVLNGSMAEYHKIDKLGVVKNVIINGNICVAFAGNLKHFNELLEYIEDNRIYDIGSITKKAEQINRKYFGDTDFIVALANNSGNELYLIQSSRINLVDACKIGSDKKTYEIFDSERKKIKNRDEMEAGCTRVTIENDLSDVDNLDSISIDRRAFKYTIKNTEDLSVGGFIISCTGSKGSFMYMEEFETNVEKKRTVDPDGIIQLFDNAEDGGYAFHFYDSTNFVSMYIYQMKKGVIYRPYLEDKDYNHLRFPTIYDCSENEFIEENNITPPSIIYG